MGTAQSVETLSSDDIHGIAQFSEKDIKRLYNRFKALDADGSGWVLLCIMSVEISKYTSL